MGLFLFTNRLSKRASVNTAAGAEQTDDANETPLYEPVEVPAIDFSNEAAAPQTKSAGMTWDETVFYRLEDVNKESSDDGYIYECVLTHTLRRDKLTGALIEYYVYRDPETAEIYKIVSVKEENGTLTLTDYYYQNGKPNFIFLRTDSIYTPTYASPSKVGKRYYFNNDVMVRLRTVDTPNVISEITLYVDESRTYTQEDYFTQTAEVQASYDATEKQMLCEAYNVYNSIANDGNVGILTASLSATDGTAVGDITVNFRRTDDDVLLYRTVTDETGVFNIGVTLDGTGCYAEASGNDIYGKETVYGITLDSAYPMSANSSLVMHKTDGDEYMVNVAVYNAAGVTAEDTDEGTKETKLPSGVSGATVLIRNGASAYEGEAIETLTTDAEGLFNVTLKSGTYTAQIDADGYATAYCTIEVSDGEVTKGLYILPSVPQGQKAVVLTWDDASYDLDITVFTPEQDTDGDMAHIGGDTLSDAYGNYIVSDNGAYCEVAYVDGTAQGDYKVYVSNYTDVQNGNLTSKILATVNVRIYIYDGTGLVCEYSVPADSSGVVWEVADINTKGYTASSRVYTSLTGKSWWSEAKGGYEYIKRSNELLAAGDCLGALEAIQDGVTETGLETLKKREEYLREHIKAFPKKLKSYNGFYGGSFDEDFFEEYTYGYSSEGLPISSTSVIYGIGGGEAIASENKYDEYGNTTESVKYAFTIDYALDSYKRFFAISNYPEISETYIAEYDENGNVTEEHYDSGTHNTYYYARDTDFYATENNYKTGSYDCFCEYDLNNRLIRETYTYPSANVTDTTIYEYTYDEYDCLIKEKVSSFTGTQTIEYTYDEYGHIAEKKTTDPDGNINRIQYHYDSMYDTEVEFWDDSWNDYSNDIEEPRLYLTYDKNKNIIRKEKSYRESGRSYGDFYEYDILGNEVMYSHQGVEYLEDAIEYLYFFYP